MTPLPTKEETKAAVAKLMGAGLISIRVEARSISTIKKEHYRHRISESRGDPKSDTGGGAEPSPTVQTRFRIPPPHGPGPNHRYITYAKDLKT